MTDSLYYPTKRLSWAGACLEVLLPHSCHICSRPLRNEILCYRCRPPLPRMSRHMEHICLICSSPLSSQNEAARCDTCDLYPLSTRALRHLWDYSLLARDFIRAMKYKPSEQLATVAGTLLSQSIPDLFHIKDWDLVIPMPSSKSGFATRLFNPCAQISLAIAKNHHLRHRNILIRNTRRRPQALLSHDERLTGLRKLFTVSKPSIIGNKSVLLVEDVITTGATIAAATETLLANGAKHVDVLALARTRVWNRFRSEIYRKLS